MRQALELALEFIERVNKDGWILADFEPEMYNTITAIKEALAQPEQCEYPRCACDNKESCKQKAQPEQEPVAWATKDDFYRELERELKRIREEMKIKSVTMRCKDYDIALPIIGTDFGRVLVGQVSTPPQRTWVGLTDKEIDAGLLRTNYAMQTAGAWRDGVEWATKQLKEKNT